MPDSKEVIRKDVVINPPTATAEGNSTYGRNITDYTVKFCPICHQAMCKVTSYDDGQVWIGDKQLVDFLVVECPNKHKIKVNKNK